MFKALRKQEKRNGLVPTDKSSSRTMKPKTMRPSPVSDQFRNFDERMAAKNVRRLGAASKVSAASSTFIMTAPTFQFNPNPVQPAPAPREVEGFHGFLSALDAPKDAPATKPNRVVHHSRPEYRTTNVFSLLDDGDEEQQKKKVETTVPTFIQPATFNIAAVTPTPSSLRQSIQSGAVDIDPDL